VGESISSTLDPHKLL